MKNKFLMIIFLISSNALLAQDSAKVNNYFSWKIYAEAYYSYDFNQPANHLKPSFLYSYNRHNEFNLNLGLVEASYNNDKIRANVGLMTGTYPEYNLSGEAAIFQNVYEANAGVKISKQKNLWIDAGIFPSHIGYETAIGKDNWTLTRSIAAENSPYYEAGAKITYTTSNNKLLLSGLLLNGWQKIQRVDGNNTPAFGTQLTFTPNDKINFNWSTYVGNELPDSVRAWRYFNDLYSIMQLSKQVGLTLGFDIGMQQQSKGSSSMNVWYAPTAVLRFTPNDNWSFAARGEYYSDKNGVIIPANTVHGFKTFGASFNVDKKVGDHFLWRTEIRTLNSEDDFFIKGNGYSKSDIAFTTSFAISF